MQSVCTQTELVFINMEPRLVRIDLLTREITSTQVS